MHNSGQTFAKLILQNVEKPDDEALKVQFNPTEFSEEISANYDRKKVLGMSHQEMQYTGTGNVKLSMTVRFLRDGTYDVDSARKYLQAFLYPMKGTSVSTSSPPRCLVIWPGMVNMVCRITDVSFQYTRFDLLGRAVEFTAGLSIEEARIRRLTSEEVEFEGSQRGGTLQRGTLIQG